MKNILCTCILHGNSLSIDRDLSSSGRKKTSTHLWMQKQIRLPTFEPSTANRFFRVSQMTVQNFLRQSQRSVVQELADQRKLVLKSTVRRSNGSTVFLFERCMSRQAPSRDEGLADSTTQEDQHRVSKAEPGSRDKYWRVLLAESSAKTFFPRVLILS